MKKISTILFALTLTTNCAFATVAAKGRDKSVVVISDDMNVFYFWVTKGWMDGVVEVFNENNDLVLSQSIEYKKISIDFYGVKPGIYTIHVKKGNLVKEFEYEIGGRKSHVREIPVNSSSVM